MEGRSIGAPERSWLERDRLPNVDVLRRVEPAYRFASYIRCWSFPQISMCSIIRRVALTSRRIPEIAKCSENVSESGKGLWSDGHKFGCQAVCNIETAQTTRREKLEVSVGILGPEVSKRKH